VMAATSSAACLREMARRRHAVPRRAVRRADADRGDGPKLIEYQRPLRRSRNARR
jgi:hypothetical protein